MASLRSSLAPGSLLLAAPVAEAAELSRGAIDGMAFFAILIGLALWTVLARWRDMLAGLDDDERRARLRRRAPIALGGLLGACLYIVMRSL
jgi:hypothetical protein